MHRSRSNSSSRGVSFSVPPSLGRFARSLVPALADFGFIHLIDGRHLRCAATAHATRPGQRLVRHIARTYRIVQSDPLSTVAQVVRSGRPQLRSEIAADPDPAPKGPLLHLQRQLAARSAIVVPLTTRGQVLGALTLGSAASGRQYSARDLRWAKRLAREVAASLTDGARDIAASAAPSRRAATTRRQLPRARQS